MNVAYQQTNYMVHSLATMVANILAEGKPSDHPPLLHTIALGVPVCRDIHIHSSYIPNDPVRDLLQLRAYHVDHKDQFVPGPSATVTLVAKGAADDATTCLCIKICWLDR